MRGGTRVTKAKFAVATVVVTTILRAVPHEAAVPPEHPHVEGRQAFVLEVEGAPSAQATCAGESLPATVQHHAARGGNLNADPRGSAAVPISLQPEASKP